MSSRPVGSEQSPRRKLFELEKALECEGNKEKLLEVITEMKQDARSVKVDGRSLIYHAAARSWWDIVLQLCAEYNFVPTDKEINDKGYTVLHWACVTADTNTVKYLTTNFCLNPFKKDVIGGTAFDYSMGTTKEYLEQLVGEPVHR